MKSLISTLSIIGMLSTQSFATTMIAVKGERAKQDQRVIKISKDQNDRHVFRLCPSAQALMECQQIGSGSFSSSELEKKIKSEKFKKYAKGAGVAGSAVVGALVPFFFLGGIPVITAGLSASLISVGGSVGAGTSYALTDIFGRSPLEHSEAQELLSLIANEELKVGVEDFDETYELIEDLLAEVEEQRSEDELKIASHINNGPRSSRKNIARTPSEKLEAIQSIGR